MLREELVDIDALVDYGGFLEGTGKCSKGEGFEGWLKGKKAILPTRIPSSKEAKSLVGFPEHTSGPTLSIDDCTHI